MLFGFKKCIIPRDWKAQKCKHYQISLYKHVVWHKYGREKATILTLPLLQKAKVTKFIQFQVMRLVHLRGIAAEANHYTTLAESDKKQISQFEIRTV